MYNDTSVYAHSQMLTILYDHLRYISPTQQLLDYPTLGVCAAEAKVDILTGESQILRADIHMDLGYR